MQTDLQILNNNQTISSKEIAELLGKSHSNIKRDIKVMCENLEIDINKLNYSTYKDCCNTTRSCFNLTKEQTLYLMAAYSIPARKIIIKRWQELEVQENKSLNNLLSLAEHLLQQAQTIVNVEKNHFTQQPQIQDKAECYYTVTQYCSLKKIQLEGREVRNLGRKATNLSNSRGVKIKRNITAINGPINLYHEDILKELI